VVKVIVWHNPPVASRSFLRGGSSTPAAPRNRPLTPLVRVPALVVAVAVVGVLSATVGGCYWLRYHDLLLTHVDLMSGMASDAADRLSLETRPLEPADIERLRYPLQRAQRFRDVSRGRRSELGSFRAFEGFVDAYGEFVNDLDRVRVGVPAPGQIAEAERRATDLEARAETIRAEVARETG
jgi:hypothetical protein